MAPFIIRLFITNKIKHYYFYQGFVLGIFSLYVYMCVPVYICVEPRSWHQLSSLTLHFTYWIRVTCWLLAGTLILLVYPDSLGGGNPCLCLSMAGNAGGCHACLNFTWFWDMNSVPGVCRWDLYPLGRLPSPFPFFLCIPDRTWTHDSLLVLPEFCHHSIFVSLARIQQWNRMGFIVTVSCTCITWFVTILLRYCLFLFSQ